MTLAFRVSVVYSRAMRVCTEEHFGNHPAKLDRYRSFWRREQTDRPLYGFLFGSWFPLVEFAALRRWVERGELLPEALDPKELIDDHLRLIREGGSVDDDLIRGAAPMQVAVPFLPGMLGCRMRILADSVMGEERNLSWQEALGIGLDPSNPWYQKYLALVDALVECAQERFPISHSAEIGPSDFHGVLRGHTQAIEDLVDEPGKAAQLTMRAADILRELTEAAWQRIPLYHGGWFDAQYSLWAPGPILRLQEDASAVYSPELYRKIVQPADRALSRHFPCAFMHLHSTSMFLLDAFLEIEDIRCFQINNDVCGPAVAEMVRHFRRVQDAGRSLLIRGSFRPDEMRLLMDSLDPRGLFLLIMVKDTREMDGLKPLIET
jgi:hypothetical protein